MWKRDMLTQSPKSGRMPEWLGKTPRINCTGLASVYPLIGAKKPEEQL